MSVQLENYIRNNVEDFDLRYDRALNIENRMRCSLEYADPLLYQDMLYTLEEWCEDNELNPDDFNLEDIF